MIYVCVVYRDRYSKGACQSASGYQILSIKSSALFWSKKKLQQKSSKQQKQWSNKIYSHSIVILFITTHLFQQFLHTFQELFPLKHHGASWNLLRSLKSIGWNLAKISKKTLTYEVRWQNGFFRGNLPQNQPTLWRKKHLDAFSNLKKNPQSEGHVASPVTPDLRSLWSNYRRPGIFRDLSYS